MEKLTQAQQNQIDILLQKSRQTGEELIIHERDKALAGKHIKTILSQSGCKGILVRSNLPGTAYANEPDTPDATSMIKANESADTMDKNKESYKVEYGRGALIAFFPLDGRILLRQSIIRDASLMPA